MRIAHPIVLTDAQSRELRVLAKRRRIEARVQVRARIVLAAAQGERNLDIGERLGLDRRSVALRRRRFLDGGIEALKQDAPRPGRRPRIDAAQEAEIVRLTLHERPKAATHWSRRSLAARVGTSASTVGRIWRRHGLKPHRVRTFKVSRDPRFQEKLEQIVGLYLDPPQHALVLCCDEKSQIQALNRTQPGLPLKKGRCGTMTHDYKRNGTTTLLAALNTLDGKVISRTAARHRHQEWLKFLKRIDQTVPADKDIHLIADNYSTHKHPTVKRWLKRHPRFHMHFTPTSASWLNMVERFFRDLSENRLRRDSFYSVKDLEAAIADYIAHHNQNPKPFIWTAKASDILAKVMRARETVNKYRTV